MNRLALVLACAALLSVILSACGTTPVPHIVVRATAVIPQSAAPNETATPQPTATPEIILVDESDCMAACHQPDPNELIDAGAMPQPADHKGRTTCLHCHAAPDRPPLPATHLGRLDPSCTVCHK